MAFPGFRDYLHDLKCDPSIVPTAIEDRLLKHTGELLAVLPDIVPDDRHTIVAPLEQLVAAHVVRLKAVLKALADTYEAVGLELPAELAKVAGALNAEPKAGKGAK